VRFRGFFSSEETNPRARMKFTLEILGMLEILRIRATPLDNMRIRYGFQMTPKRSKRKLLPLPFVARRDYRLTFPLLRSGT